MPCVGRGKYDFECPNKTGKVCDPARASTGRSGSDTDWVFVDGSVAKELRLGGVLADAGFILE